MRRSRDDAFRRAADAHQHVDAAVRRAPRRSRATSPSRMRRTLAPASRSSLISSSCRALEDDYGDSPLVRPLRLATARTLSVGDALMSITSTASGPTAILSM